MAAVQEVSLQQWEKLARLARHKLLAGQNEEACEVQLQALEVARRLLGSPLLATQPDHCLAAFVVSWHNLADLWQHKEQTHLAIAALCEAHLGLLATGQATQSQIRHAVWRHLRETHGALLQWQRLHGSSPAIDSALLATGSAMPHSAQTSGTPLH